MCSIPIPQRIASAYAVFCGRYGDVSHLAQQRGVCRQFLYRQAHALAAVLDDSAAQQQTLQSLRTLVQQQHAQLDSLRRQLSQAVVLDDDKRAQFAAVAQATGVSLSATRALLKVLLGPAAPSVSTLGRLSAAAARRASAVLQLLDPYSRSRARQVAADEIFAGKKPVLMTVEQDSLCWLGGRLADNCSGPQWLQEFRQLPKVEQVTRDGGQGMEKGLALANQERRQQDQPEIADQEDHFHILHRGRRGLREVRHKAVQAFHKAEKAQKALDRDEHRGVPRKGGARLNIVRWAWKKAEAAVDRWSAQERAFGRLQASLRLFTAEGELNSRPRAEAEAEAALAELTGPEWSRLKHGLVGPKAFSFLDQVEKQLTQLRQQPAPGPVPPEPAAKPTLAEPAPGPVPPEPAARELVAAALQVEGLRRQPQGLQGETARARMLRGVMLAAGLVLSLSGERGKQVLAQVRALLNQTWRSSSLVEGLNSVVRMQQSRQKRLTQGLLDLKRLYWNTHEFVAGKRKKSSPYGRLGVTLPEGEWWLLLKIPPEQLRQQLSALNSSP
jgi:hypothetical protein